MNLRTLAALAAARRDRSATAPTGSDFDHYRGRGASGHGRHWPHRLRRATRSRNSRSTSSACCKNVIGPRRNLVLARLEGGPLEKTGVIAGMSGSPVYIDGRMLGAVSYSLGQFSKEPIAGHHADRRDDRRHGAFALRRPARRPVAMSWPPTPQDLLDDLGAAISAAPGRLPRTRRRRSLHRRCRPLAAAWRRCSSRSRCRW